MKQLLLDRQQYVKSMKLQPRSFIFDLDLLSLHKFIAFVGGRRVGKTHTMIACVQQLVKQGIIEFEDVVYIDFNEIVAEKFDFQELLADYLSMYPTRKPFFVFDEIQELPNFRHGLFSLYNQGYTIFISGSNSKLLSSELSTHFRGKVREYHIHPLSLIEFLDFNNFLIKKHYTTSEQGKLTHLIDAYITFGGYPEIALISDPHKKVDLAKTYLDVMIYKDVLERYNIENEYALKYCIKRILESSSKQLSIHGIYNDLKSQHIKISVNSLYNIVQYLQNVFFVDLLENYYNAKGQKKVYPIDTIYHHVYARNTDYGQKFETIVYHHLKKITKTPLYYKKNSYETDFYSDSLGNIQVAWELHLGNISREVKTLHSGGTIITYKGVSSDLRTYCADRNIQVVSLYEYVTGHEF